MQGVFLKLYKSPPSLEVEDNRLKAWLIRVTINKSRDYIRAIKRRRKAGRSYIPPAQHGSNDDVFEAIAKLPERDRDALYLHYYEGYTAREIADILGGNERAMTKRIGRAREKLKNFLKE